MDDHLNRKLASRLARDQRLGQRGAERRRLPEDRVGERLDCLRGASPVDGSVRRAGVVRHGQCGGDRVAVSGRQRRAVHAEGGERVRRQSRGQPPGVLHGETAIGESTLGRNRGQRQRDQGRADQRVEGAGGGREHGRDDILGFPGLTEVRGGARGGGAHRRRRPRGQRDAPEPKRTPVGDGPGADDVLEEAETDAEAGEPPRRGVADPRRRRQGAPRRVPRLALVIQQALGRDSGGGRVCRGALSRNLDQRRDSRERQPQKRRGEARADVRERRRVPPQRAADVRSQRAGVLPRGAGPGRGGSRIIGGVPRQLDAERDGGGGGVSHRRGRDERVGSGRRAQRRERRPRQRRVVHLDRGVVVVRGGATIRESRVRD